MSKTLFIVRGLPGSGKSTKAQVIFKDSFDAEICEADQYFLKSGEYKFDPKMLGFAHAECLQKAQHAMKHYVEDVIVSNTATRHSECKAYLDFAKIYDYEVIVINVFDGGKTDEELAQRNVHKVPLEVIKKMRARWET